MHIDWVCITLPILLRNLHIKMNLRTYLDSLPRGGVGQFARRVGVSTVYLSQIASGQDGRQPSPRLAVVIERESSGTVTRQEMFPNDWQSIWPELAPPEGEVSAAH